jgi:hypothetical protein
MVTRRLRHGTESAMDEIQNMAGSAEPTTTTRVGFVSVTVVADDNVSSHDNCPRFVDGGMSR